MPPRNNLLRALGPALPLLLALVGVGMGAFYVFFTRPRAIRFAQQGRRVVGNVLVSSVPKDGNVQRRADRSYSTIAVNDPELGWQIVQEYGVRPVGEAVPLLCLTSAGRCLTVGEVTADVTPWPPNLTLVIAGGALVLAAGFGLALRRKE